jgi:hypothetical protein
MSTVPEAVADMEIADDLYHKCQTCHTTIDIPLDLYLRLDSGVFQNGEETRAVDLNEPWYVGIYWCLLGGLAKTTCVDWCVSVHFESMGDDPEFEVPNVVETEFCQRCWRLRVTTDKIEVEGRECGDVYRIIVVVTARDKCRGKPVGITGFCDLGIVQFYTGHTEH